MKSSNVTKPYWLIGNRARNVIRVGAGEVARCNRWGCGHNMAADVVAVAVGKELLPLPVQATPFTLKPVGSALEPL